MNRRTSAQAALSLGALGVVYGDIGTSPLYTVQTLFNPNDPHPVAANHTDVFGAISVIFWTLTIIVTITYVLLVLRADNDGEGGILALITLIRRRAISGGMRTKIALSLLGVFGASLFFGDSMITPAISVLSAIEGVKIAAPSVAHLVLEITAAIIVCLFLLQRFGTGLVGRLFGPVMAVWFACIGAAGLHGVLESPEILKALSPTYAVSFLFGHFGTSFFSLAAVILAVTGAEALYADLGHFGRKPITRIWLLLVFPALVLSYMGQGALILDNTSNISNPFFLLLPGWGQLPMVFLAAAATVIASQAVITGAFSMAQQAAQLGYLPRLRILHTSRRVMGQIYVPWINWALMFAVLALIVTFRSSNRLAYAYGAAVGGTFVITTFLFFYIVRHRWKKPLWMVVPGAAVLLGFELLIFSANMTKFLHGAWLPLVVAGATFTVLVTWQRGRQLVSERRERDEGELRPFVEKLYALQPPLQRVPGTAIFLNRGKKTAPLAMRANVEHNHVLHENAIILSLETRPVPHVPPEKRLTLDDLGHRDDGITFVAARFGYMDEPNVPDLIPLLREVGLARPLDEDDLTYFLSTMELARGDAPGLSRWQKHLFLATSRLTADAAEHFHLPRNRTVIMGSRIDV